MKAVQDKNKTKSGRRLRTKVRNDGKAIAAAEHAVHRLKGTVNEGKMTSSGRQISPYENLPNLLTSVEEQEAAWLLAVADPLHFAARLPISQATGCIPVDLYRKTVSTTMTTSANNVCFALCAQDRWNTFAATAPWYTGILGPDGATGVWSTVTAAPYATTVFPSFGGVVPAGCASYAIGDVSSDIVSDGSLGTEYIMVASSFRLTPKMVANAAADARYSGRLTAFLFVDPQRVSASGRSRDDLMALAREQNPLVYARTYIITGDGLFVPEDDPDSPPLPAIQASAVPITVQSYEWNRCGLVGLSSTANVAVGVNVAFVMEAPSGTQFDLEGTYLWQLERFSTNKVSDRLDDVPFFSPDSSYYDDDDLEALDGDDEMEFLSVPGPGGKTQLVSAGTRKPKKKRRVHHASHRGPRVVPPAALSLANATMKLPGQPIHPAVPLLAVTSAAAQTPGVRQSMFQLSRDSPGKIGVVGPKLARLAADHGPRAAEIFHESVSKSKDSGNSGGWWSKIKNIASGAWDVAKFAAPLVMSLL